MSEETKQDLLVVSSKVKAFISAAGFRSSKDFLPAASKALEKILQDAMENAKDDKRQTLRPSDLP